MRKMEEGLRTCTTSDPVSWHVSRIRIGVNEKRCDVLRKNGGSRGVYESSVIYETLSAKAQSK
jgi:hypothetical protein